jgi:hypothetical protein
MITIAYRLDLGDDCYPDYWETTEDAYAAFVKASENLEYEEVKLYAITEETDEFGDSKLLDEELLMSRP